MSKIITTTDRLIIREKVIEDSEFILQHYNEPLFIKNIADKKIYTLDDAKQFLINGPIKSYQENGFGMFLIVLKDSNTPIGTCGLMKRDNTDDIDLGYALMSDYHKQGYVLEAAKAVLEYAKNEIKLTHILGYTALDNSDSMNVLKKLGFSELGESKLAGYDTPSLKFSRNL
ncbi:GNAT family N-acetyltransferase [Pseudoalteromonas sp. C2R02]|uniref:GNAT family N-acetyltransferase n=1 Tax=Pseudoalteromonas sp. C2R02 TaxID=2841565 RepID=UPI001C097D2D|nr:GNAT family N-acetyltransferase [Pseudoalteromonas sp. C2R02]MBU2972185.1 GNAT family N-acetyltransferase [Pseudoalteromonas sp. C2R02]